jgi:hypothetical protein
MSQLAAVRDITVTGPLPPEGEHFCTVCAGVWKAAVLARPGAVAAISDAEAGKGRPFIDLRKFAEGISPPQVAVAYGVSPNLNGALVECCWKHLSGITFTSLAVGSGLAKT